MYIPDERPPSPDEKRHYYCIASQRLEEIRMKYNKCPDASLLSEDSRAWLNWRIQMVGEAIVKTKDENFYNYHFFRTLRNDIAHSIEDKTFDQQNYSWRRFFNKIQGLEISLKNVIAGIFSSNKKLRNFEQENSPRIGSASAKKVVDAAKDKLDPELNDNERVSFPKNNRNDYNKKRKNILKKETNTHNKSYDLSEIQPAVIMPDDIFKEAMVDIPAAVEEIFEVEDLEQKSLFEYAQEHAGLHESILIDIVEWIRRIDLDLSRDNPFIKEELFITNIHELKVDCFTLDMFDTLYHDYSELPSVYDSTRGDVEKSEVNFDFYKSKLEAVEYPKEDKKETENGVLHSKETLLRNLIRDIDDSYIIRKTEWEMKEVEKRRNLFKKELFEKISRFRRLEELIFPFISNLGYLWDMSSAPFKDNGFELLKQYADILDKDTFLTELAKLLGRQNYEQMIYEKELHAVSYTDSSYHVMPAYRGEISGLRLSNEISSVIPSEFALYQNSMTRKYLMLKFAQKQLLSYAYEKEVSASRDDGTQYGSINELIRKGPIIVCVDSSASMHGIPEQIAKTITFALTKIAIEEQRNCFLISFSTDIETLDLSSFKGADAIVTLISFLRKSFNGGTNALKALTHTANLLLENSWKNSDVLMISDFIMQNIPDNLTQKIKQAQENGTGFYSLAIGDNYDVNNFKYFDKNWNYNPYDPTAQKMLVKQLDILKKRKVKSGRT